LIPCTVKKLIFGEEEISLILISLYSRSFGITMTEMVSKRQDTHKVGSEKLIIVMIIFINLLTFPGLGNENFVPRVLY